MNILQQDLDHIFQRHGIENERIWGPVFIEIDWWNFISIRWNV